MWKKPNKVITSKSLSKHLLSCFSFFEGSTSFLRGRFLYLDKFWRKNSRRRHYSSSQLFAKLWDMSFTNCIENGWKRKTYTIFQDSLPSVREDIRFAFHIFRFFWKKSFYPPFAEIAPLPPSLQVPWDEFCQKSY